MSGVIICCLLAYLIGSISSAVFIGKTFYNTDVREHGSHNAGATNTFRVLGKKAGIIVLSMDLVKGALAVLLAYAIPLPFESGTAQHLNLKVILGMLAVLGHVFPLFARFKGGKGIATLVGMMLAVHPSATLLCILLFLIILSITKYVSLGSMLGSLLFPLLLFLVFKETDSYLPYVGILIFGLVVLTHKKNIKRLLNGEENKTYLFKK